MQAKENTLARMSVIEGFIIYLWQDG